MVTAGGKRFSCAENFMNGMDGLHILLEARLVNERTGRGIARCGVQNVVLWLRVEVLRLYGHSST